MSKLFLASYFNSVAPLLADFLKVELEAFQGAKMAYICVANSQLERIEQDKEALKSMGFEIDEIPLASTSPEKIALRLSLVDYIFVTGDNSYALLQELRRSGADTAIKSQVDTIGKTYIGVMAGAAVAAPNLEYMKHMDDIAQAPALDTYLALWLINFYPIINYRCSPFTRQSRITYKEFAPQIKTLQINDEQVIIADEQCIEIWDNSDDSRL